MPLGGRRLPLGWADGQRQEGNRGSMSLPVAQLAPLASQPVRPQPRMPYAVYQYIAYAVDHRYTRAGGHRCSKRCSRRGLASRQTSLSCRPDPGEPFRRRARRLQIYQKTALSICIASVTYRSCTGS